MLNLKKKHEKHDAEVRRLANEMCRLKRRVSTQGGDVRLRDTHCSIARVLVCMRNGEPTAAVDNVSRSCKTRCLNATGRAPLEADLRGWWRGTAAATRRTYLVEDGAKVKLYKAIKQARRFVVDTDLEAWVDDQNVRKGINPFPRTFCKRPSL